MNEKELNKICLFIKKLNKNEPLNMDDIDTIARSLMVFNGEI